MLNEALRAQAAGIAHTTVWTRLDDPVVVAFYAIAPTQFIRTALPSRGRSARPRSTAFGMTAPRERVCRPARAPQPALCSR